MWGVWFPEGGHREGFSQGPQMQDLVNVKPHPVVSPREEAGG